MVITFEPIIGWIPPGCYSSTVLIFWPDGACF
jgi:hypothetical protein